MPLAKQYKADEAESRWEHYWSEQGIYHFAPNDQERPVFSVDTPPPTVSGHLHVGHVYSYSHIDFITRFWRMNDYNVFYPQGFDDNGLPTDRLVERLLGMKATEVGRSAFIAKCLEVGEEAEREYEALWRRLGFGIDWRYRYRTIDHNARHTSQWSFVDLYRKGLAYRQKAPAIWCPECRTAIAQADLHDLERESQFVTLDFRLQDGTTLPIATTRPELLPACVAVFVHPRDQRYTARLGETATVPLFHQQVPIMADEHADPEKGTGAVMCCTFGDTTDVQWWFTHKLPLIATIDREGRMTGVAGELAGLPVAEARRTVVERLEREGLVLGSDSVSQSVRAHERCDTPVEYIETSQWFVRVLDFKQELLEIGERIAWHPAHMKARYQNWVENLAWDWCISRQRYFGVPFPIWYCNTCEAIVVAAEDQLPVDPAETLPETCPQCSGSSLVPEEDVMDTWATSSVSPQIAGQWLNNPALYERVFPMSLRPQAHEIIRTWAFYSIAKSHFHFKTLPWQNVMISGWGLAAPGTGKISKSRGGGPIAPMELIARYSADAVRYWAASGGLGRDLVISEEKVAAGARLVTKLWNVARFAERFLAGYTPPQTPPDLAPTDRWLLSRLNRLVQRATEHFRAFDYAAANQDVEAFFWSELADNYIEMAKLRLYDHSDDSGGAAARYTLYQALLAVLKLFAPILPFITEEIYQGLFSEADGAESVHLAAWPAVHTAMIDDHWDRAGDRLVGIATAVRRYKSAQNVSISKPLGRLLLITDDVALATALQAATPDLMSVTRAAAVDVNGAPAGNMQQLEPYANVEIAIEPSP